MPIGPGVSGLETILAWATEKSSAVSYNAAMTGLEFVANIIDNIFSWPVAVLLIVWLLRRPLADLFRTVESFVVEAGGTRISFSRGLERVRETITEAKVDAEAQDPDMSRGEVDLLDPDSPLVLKYQRILDLAREDPIPAIEIAWDTLIATPTQLLARDNGLDTVNRYGLGLDTMELLRALNSRKIVSKAMLDSAQVLRNLRVHASLTRDEIATDQAVQYTHLAGEVGRYLNGLRNKSTHASEPE